MRSANKNKHLKPEKDSKKSIEQAAEAWARLCLFHIYQKYQNKNTDYEYSK